MKSNTKIFVDNFQIIISAYCEGLKSYPGEVHDDMVYVLIRDLAPMFEGAVKYGYDFDLLTIAEKFCEAGMFRLSPEGIVSSLLSLLPNPGELTANEQDTLIKILNAVEECIPGTMERMQWEWQQAA